MPNQATGSEQSTRLTLDPEAERVKAHWLKYRPNMARQLQREGKLYQSVLAATDLMRNSQADLVGKGMDYNRALEISRPMAYLPEESAD